MGCLTWPMLPLRPRQALAGCLPLRGQPALLLLQDVPLDQHVLFPGPRLQLRLTHGPMRCRSTCQGQGQICGRLRRLRACCCCRSLRPCANPTCPCCRGASTALRGCGSARRLGLLLLLRCPCFPRTCRTRGSLLAGAGTSACGCTDPLILPHTGCLGCPAASLGNCAAGQACRYSPCGRGAPTWGCRPWALGVPLLRLQAAACGSCGPTPACSSSSSTATLARVPLGRSGSTICRPFP